MAFRRLKSDTSDDSAGSQKKSICSCFSFCLPRSHPKRTEEANIYEIVESTQGPYRSGNKTLDKLAKKARDRAESIQADQNISSITKEIFFLRTSSLSDISRSSTMNSKRSDSQATEIFANWANSLRINKSNSSLDKSKTSPSTTPRNRSCSNPPAQSSTSTPAPDNDFDDYAEPVDRVPTRRPLALTKSDSRGSDRGYHSMYTSISSNPSPRSTAVYKPTEDSDYDELEEESVQPATEKQFRITRSNTYSTPEPLSKNTEYSFLNRVSKDGKQVNKVASNAARMSTPGNGKSAYCSPLKVAETGGEYSHLTRMSQGLKNQRQSDPAKRFQQAPTLRHDDEDDYDYLEAESSPPPKGHKKKKTKKKSDKAETKQQALTPVSPNSNGDYDKLHRQFKAKQDTSYESIWPRKK